MAGKLEIDTGGMYAEKSTNLIRKAKRKIRAGKKVVFLKPAIDDRYSQDEVVTHDGVAYKANPVKFEESTGDNVKHPVTGELMPKGWMFYYPVDEVTEADIICIDEVQFFPEVFTELIDFWLYEGKDVYAAGLDLDRFGKPFGIVPYLLARAEVVTKHSAVCAFCGSDAWVTIGTENLTNNSQVNVGNDYVPACRTCAAKEGGVS